jgi:hypothetical protein
VVGYLASETRVFLAGCFRGANKRDRSCCRLYWSQWFRTLAKGGAKGFLRKFIDNKRPVIPVLMTTAPQAPELPTFLAGRMWVDFRQNDLDPMHQLVWGITGRNETTQTSATKTPVPAE